MGAEKESIVKEYDLRSFISYQEIIIKSNNFDKYHPYIRMQLWIDLQIAKLN